MEKIMKMNWTTIVAQQTWEENQVPPGVPFCLTREIIKGGLNIIFLRAMGK
jgi:hypothetical protein